MKSVRLTTTLAMVACLSASGMAAGQAPSASRQPLAFRPTHTEGTPLGRSAKTKIRQLTAFCLDRAGNILACDGKANAVRVLTPDDRLRAVWKVGFSPEAVAYAPDGTVYVGGAGRMAKLNVQGRIVKQTRGRPATPMVTSIAVGNGDVFVAGESNLGYAVFRMSSDLARSKRIIDGLSGCCGQMDIAWQNGMLRVAENGRKRVVSYTRDGRTVSSWAKESDDDANLDGFSGCCNPKNLCPGPGGRIYTSESELGRVKCYTPNGVMAAYVGAVKGPPGCVRATVAANRDGSRIYVLDGDANVIRVLKGPAMPVPGGARGVRTEP